MVIQMCMRCSDHDVMIAVLNIHQFVRKHPEMVIVDKRYRADDLGIRRFDSGAHQFVSNKIPERFRSIRIALSLYEPVKPRKKIRIDGNANAAEFRHTFHSSTSHRIVCVIPITARVLSERRFPCDP